MASVFDQLHIDHINVVKLLEHFKEELIEYSNSDSEPNYLKWQNILLYMTTYQDVFHHPTEEKLFAYIRNYDPEIGQSIKELESQHEMLYSKNKSLHELIASVESPYANVEITKNDLIAICKDYINLLLEHMSLEESIVFPFAQKKMLDNDWTAFEKETDHIEDPLFSAERRAEFDDLYQCICAQ